MTKSIEVDADPANLVGLAMEDDDQLLGSTLSPVHVYEVVPDGEAARLDDVAQLLAQCAVIVHDMRPAYRAVLQAAYRRHLAKLAPDVDFGA